MASRFKIVVFDLDGVLFDAPSSWGFIHEHFGETNEANVQAYFNGEIDDNEFMRRDIQLWKSHKPDLVMDDLIKILEEIPIIPGAVETIRTLRKQNIIVAILSGGLDLLANRFNDIEKIDHIFANSLVYDGSGKLKGEGILNVPLMDKKKILIELLSELSISSSECCAVGDSMVDSEMLATAGLGIAFCPINDKLTDFADVVINTKNLSEIIEYIV